MTVVTIHKAKTNLSKLIASVEEGAEVVIARGNEKVAKLVSIKMTGKRVPGTLKGLMGVPDDSALTV